MERSLIPHPESINAVPLGEPKTGDETITIRLSGNFMSRWKSFTRLCGMGPGKTKVTVLREALSILFACSSIDDHGDLVEVVIRRKDKEGKQLPDSNLTELLNLPFLTTYRENWAKENKK